MCNISYYYFFNQPRKTVKRIAFIFLIFLAGCAKPPQKDASSNAYQFSIDLRKVQEDQLPVTLRVPDNIQKDEIAYFLPKIVPGTYSIYDFGRFVSNLKAFDKKGNELPVKRKNDNEWVIRQARKLHKITYLVEDTYDTEKDNFVFEPGGTNIEAGENFIINTHGFFGYFKGMKFQPFRLTVHRPEGFYGATSMIAEERTQTSDTYQVEDYNAFVDAPLMYNPPDTLTLDVGGADILISVYSPGDKLSAEQVAEGISTILTAQKDYLGGTLPIEKYAFIIYLFDGRSGSGAYGALEHSYSSLYFLPEYDAEQLMSTITDVSAHEFFHILTPLSIHSEEIHYFDFNEPKMSKHLWLYEGTVEYFAQHVQLYEGLIDLEAFLKRMRQKLVVAEENYKTDLPFTELSLGALDEHKDQYGNVYQKGALISLCLDVKLRELSDGEMGMMDLMQKLSDTYGKDQPFKDEELFDKIVELSYPEIGTFLTQHVAGTEPLPIPELMKKVGISYEAERTVERVSVGLPRIYPNEEGEFVVVSTEGIDEVGQAMGYQEGDILKELNGTELSMKNIRQLYEELVSNAKAGDKLEVTVMRKQDNDEREAKTLSTELKAVEQVEEHFFSPNPKATQTQRELLEAWAGEGVK